MLLHGVKDSEFEIYHGDSLTNDWDLLREANPAKMPKFDAIGANPPFSYRWDASEAAGEDSRFKAHGVTPKSAADFAFMLPHGVLFRGGVEERVRTKLLTDGHVDTVIGLPANLFYSTGIPVCVLVLKMCKKPDDVLFISASEGFVKGKRQNQLTGEHIQRIASTYQNRAEAEGYAKRVALAEIAEKNGYNLNLSRHVSTAKKETEIDLAATHAELVAIEQEIREAKGRHNAFLRELGLAELP